MLTPWKESYDQPWWHSKKQRHYFANKGPSGWGYGFSSGHVWMWQLDCEESWVLKNWCFWTVVLEKTFESPLDCKVIQLVISPGCSLKGRILKLKLQYLATWCEELTHLKWFWCWQRLRAGSEGDDRGWNGWMPSPTQWTWVWVDSGSWWWTARSGMLRFMESQSRTWLSDWTELTEWLEKLHRKVLSNL